MKLYNLYKEVIMENTDRDVVIDAIDNRYRVKITYAGDENTPSGDRHIIVYALGTSKAGNPVIRAWQAFGVSASEKPAWKLFRLDRITSWEPTKLIYYKPIPNYNPNGDNSMVGMVYNAEY